MPQDRTFRPPNPKTHYPDPERPRRWVQCFSPQDRTHVRFKWLNNWVAGVHTHYLWNADPRLCRTVPCLRELGECPWCPMVKNRKWKGYCGALVRQSTRPVLMELTENAYETCRELRDNNGQLRGWEYETFREKDHTRSKQFLRRMHVLHADPAWPAVDICAVLARIWSVEPEVTRQLFPFMDGAGGWGHPDFTHKTHEERKEDKGQIGPAKPIDPKTPAPKVWRQAVDAKQKDEELKAQKTGENE
jgi:hypothetical protein